jgi:O-antigen ligase
MTLGHKACDAAGFLLLAAIVYAPWAFGCVTPATVAGLELITQTSAALWIAGLVLQRRPPRICAVALTCVGLLLLLGCWMVANAHGRYERDHLVHIRSWCPALPGAVDGPICAAMMLQIAGMLAALLVACDLARQNAWRWRFIIAMAAAGSSIACWGLLQKMGLLPALAHREYAESAFATYDYHGNAGAYLNLTIPAVFAVALKRHRKLATAALLICVAAALANVSRAAAAICLVMVFALVGWQRQFAIAPAEKGRRWLAPALLLAFVAITLTAGGAAWKRWNQLSFLETTDNPRLIMVKIAAPMAVDAGFFGDGPGSFKLFYFNSPHLIPALYSRWKVAPYHPGEETSIYSYVHNDYLQYTIEWGWIGAALWATLIATAVARGSQAYPRGEDRVIIAVSLIALAGVLTHALVDWPLQVASLQLYTAIYLALLLASPPCASC